ncbi:MAG TPA: cyclic pyranopterin monophosphate synthase MoaC [Syntrophales bacterium]|nr:cyclic pyranopterin monophosphate synthase MoaC [Syntrophales bacterium]
MKLTHLDRKGKARMVDITGKASTVREALAVGTVRVNPDVIRMIEESRLPKGDVFATARIAGIMAAKKTAGIIPLCHPLALTDVDVELKSDIGRGEILIRATARTVGRTGVEMEAMTAVSVAALTVYDMCKSADRGIVLTEIKLVKKKGGKSGTFVRKEVKGRE